jgi:hypothetical protein
MRLLRYLLLPAALAVALALPAGTGAVIVPQQGMLGVKIGMTRAQIQARLGPPDAVRRPTSEIFGRYTEYRYGEVRIGLFNSNGRAFSFQTRGRSARTVKGVGVGSSEAYVRSAMPGIRCRTEFGVRSCLLGRLEVGRIVTSLFVSRRTGRVTRVAIGRVID